MRMMRLARNSQENRRGAAVVEMAFVLPVFLMIVLGIVEFGRAMMVGQLLTNGARHGARKAIIDGSTNASVEQDIKDFLTQTLNVPATDITVVIEAEPAPGNTDPNDILSATESKDLIKITVRVGFDDVSYIAGNFLQGTNLEGHCAMRHE